MPDAFPLIEGWGFEHKNILTWVKDRIGVGHWLRSNTEFVVMAVKGRPKLLRHDQPTVIYGPMREHSRKPEEFYQMVETLCIGRCLDYFSREKRPGWEQFGDEPEKFQNGVS